MRQVFTGFVNAKRRNWHPYNPNAGYDARIEAVTLYTDPIHQFTTFDSDEDDPKVKPAAPDSDL